MAWRLLLRDRRGVSAVEFAMISPVVFMLLFGVLNFGHQVYVASIIDGAMAKAGRDSSLESAFGDQAAIETAIEEAILPVAPSATFDFTRRNYQDFTRIDQPEDFTDANGNDVYDSDECFFDINGNKTYDTDRARGGQGGADDVAVVDVEVTYDRLFPMYGLGELGQQVTSRASTVFRNQPYNDQEERTAVQICPTV